MDLSNVIYHTVCQCQYKFLMESTRSPLNGMSQMLHKAEEKIRSESQDKVHVHEQLLREEDVN